MTRNRKKAALQRDISETQVQSVEPAIKPELKEIIKKETLPAPFSPKKTQKNRKQVTLKYEESDVKPTDLNISTISNTAAPTGKFEPPHWRQTLENIRSMRKKHPAPVDSMGCDKCSEENYDEKSQRYHCLLSLMLSSQTKDQITFDAMKRLKNRCENLTPTNFMKLSDYELEELLKPVSFYKTKAKHMKIATQMLIDQYDSDIPETIEGLLKLPGVGKKMAYLAMNTAWKKIEGIGVDTHVHRISNWLKWVPKPTKTPEDTRVALEEWLPRDLWDEVNHLMVGFGQTVCTAKNPHCEICDNFEICPARVIKTEKKKVNFKKEHF